MVFQFERLIDAQQRTANAFFSSMKKKKKVRGFDLVALYFTTVFLLPHKVIVTPKITHCAVCRVGWIVGLD